MRNFIYNGTKIVTLNGDGNSYICIEIPTEFGKALIFENQIEFLQQSTSNSTLIALKSGKSIYASMSYDDLVRMFKNMGVLREVFEDVLNT